MTGTSLSKFQYMGTRPDSDFGFSLVDNQTILFKLPSMGDKYAGLVQKRLHESKALLDSMPNLIIDCRGNPGGSFATWSPIKRYLYANPTITDGYLYWASEDNAQYVEQNLIRPSSTRKEKKRIKARAKAMRKRPGVFVGNMNAYRETLREVTPNPKKVVILVDGKCASSCEEFVFWARQSSKVSILGVQTAGVADFGALNTLSIPCLNWRLTYPTARNNRVADKRGIDNIGIMPDACIEPETADWVKFAREWMDKH